MFLVTPVFFHILTPLVRIENNVQIIYGLKCWWFTFFYVNCYLFVHFLPNAILLLTICYWSVLDSAVECEDRPTCVFATLGFGLMYVTFARRKTSSSSNFIILVGLESNYFVWSVLTWSNWTIFFTTIQGRGADSKFVSELRKPRKSIREIQLPVSRNGIHNVITTAVKWRMGE